MIPFLTKLTGLLRPVGKLIDAVHTSHEEKLQMQNEWAKIQGDIFRSGLEYETELIQAQASIIRAEAQGASWLQRNWRPLLMMTIISIIANNFLLLPYAAALGLPIVPLDLPDKMWTLMTVGVGGYIASRGAEKIIPNTRFAKE